MGCSLQLIQSLGEGLCPGNEFNLRSISQMATLFLASSVVDTDVNNVNPFGDMLATTVIVN